MMTSRFSFLTISIRLVYHIFIHISIQNNYTSVAQDFKFRSRFLEHKTRRRISPSPIFCIISFYALRVRPCDARAATIASVAGASSCLVRVLSLDAKAKRSVIAEPPSAV